MYKLCIQEVIVARKKITFFGSFDELKRASTVITYTIRMSKHMLC